MKTRSRLPEDGAGAADGPRFSPEERLQRLALGLMDAEQDSPGHPAVPASIPADKIGHREWRGSGFLIAIVIAITGLGAMLLQTLSRPQVHQNLSADSATQVHSAVSAPIAPIAGDSKRVIAQPHVETARDASADTAPRIAAPAGPTLFTPPLPQHDAALIGDSAQIAAVAVAPKPETDKPVLWIYYSSSSSFAGENAQNLATQLGSKITSFTFKNQIDLPRIAVIRPSDEKNRILAVAIGNLLAHLGYKWRIANVSNSQISMVEVWLPIM